MPASSPTPAPAPAPSAAALTVLTAAEAAHRAAAHAAAADARTAAHLERRARGEKHPVEDFLYTYYPFAPAQLARWNPGAGVAVASPSPESAVIEDLRSRKWFTTAEVGGASAVVIDLPQWQAARGDGARFIRDLVARTLGREGTFGCFGLHEWAMVYKQSPDRVRHDQVPLRLGSAETDQVVETHRIRCSHFDAFRFFTPEAVPLNELTPARDTMQEMEQPGCLHGGMDLYKWTMKLTPIVPSDIVLAAFDLARDIRTLDMEASPYDVRDWGYGVVAIETPEGKAEYVRRQREFTVRGNAIRADLIAAIDRALPTAP